MSRAAARPAFRILAVLLHAFCASAGPGLHLWLAADCGCGRAASHSAAVPSPGRAACDRSCCRHHAPAAVADEAEPPGVPEPAHDPDDCPVCRLLALPRVLAPAVRLILTTVAAPLAPRPLSPAPPLVAAAA